MIEFTPVGKLVNLQLSETTYERLAEEFAHQVSDAVYLSAGKVFVGVLTRESFLKVNDETRGRVLDMMNARCERVVVNDGLYRPKDRQQAIQLRRRATGILMEKPGRDRVILLGRGGNLNGVFLRKVETECSSDAYRAIAQYLRLVEMGFRCLGGYLADHGWARIAVYSPGVTKNSRSLLDTVVIDELVADSRITVKYIVSKTLTTLGGVELRAERDISSLSGVDAILVPTKGYVDRVLWYLGDRDDVVVVALTDVLERAFALEIEETPMIQALHNLSREGGKVLVVVNPSVERMEERTPYEELLTQQRAMNLQGFLANVDVLWGSSPLCDGYTKDDWLAKINDGCAKFIPYRDYWLHEDIISDIENVSNGVRATLGSPAHTDVCLRIFGDSVAYGRGIRDCDTIASRLQKVLNGRDLVVRVENHGVSAANLAQIASMIRDTRISKDDITIVEMRDFKVSAALEQCAIMNGVPVYRANDDFNGSSRTPEPFADMHHLNGEGNQLLAERLFDQLFGGQAMTPEQPPSEFRRSWADTYAVQTHPEYFDAIANSPEFRAYLRGLRDMYEPVDGQVGSIVMNCNPFTLGHQFLVERAASECSVLYVFVVEEDRSVFPFADRLELVRQGVSALPNVRVLPSGDFIISALTFPEYFEKGDLQDQAIDPSEDVELFAKYIAPELGITKRFVGEEPLDRVTLQYNEAMRRILPQYGVEFEVIPRKEFGNEVISASRVRALLQDRDFDAISKIVPKSTLDYLARRFG